MPVVWLAADVLLAAVAASAVLIGVTGGTTLVVHDVTVRLHSTGNLLGAWSLIAAARCLLGPRRGFLGVPAWTPIALDRQARTFLPGLRSWLTPERALRLAGAVVLAATAVKVTNAVLHPGFFSGDDVEIHEMTLGTALGKDWPVWHLRSPFYPMVFIYPIQRLLIATGTSDVGTLVIAGRMVGVALSGLAALLLFAGANRRHGPAIALTACAFFALSRLQIDFGSTELPRPVATLFVIAAYLALLRPGPRRAAVAGVALGVAACMRFSEAAFIIPAVLQLGIERRARDLMVLLAAATASAIGIQGVSDALYWGEPFQSARAIVSYTLIERQSSRGYESVLHYVVHPTSWSNLVILTLAAIGWRRDWRAALWFALPVLLLSVLPHKEPRYLIPVGPFLALVAAQGLWRAVEDLDPRVSPARASGTRSFPLALGLVAALALAAIFEVDGYHVRRSDHEVERARDVGPAALRGVPGEDLWRFGGRLYLDR